MFSFLSSRIPDTAKVDAVFSEAFACVEQGLCYDEVNDVEHSLEMYERGLELISKGEKMKNATKSELYNNLMEAKKSIQNRITALRKTNEPSNTERVVTTVSEKDKEEEAAKSSIRNELDAVGEEADLIFFIPDGVQLFMINGESTTAPTYPTSLQILRFHDSEATSFKAENNEPVAFIQVGPWVYPLIQNKTPVLKNEYGAYVVPNPTPADPDMMVAILLPTDLEQRVHDEFRQVIGSLAVLRDQEVKSELSAEENKRMSLRIAKFLINSGEKIAWGLQTTTVRVTSSVEERGAKYRENLVPNQIPTNISPSVRTSLVYMHKGSKVVAKCTRFLLDKIGDIGVAVGRSVASSAQTTLGDGKGGRLVTGTLNVLSGGIAGASTVWIAMEDASKNLCRSIANQTVENVKVKYGDEASESTHHALFAAGHGTLAAAQIWDMGPRSIAGRMARKAGLQVVTDLHGKREKVPIMDKKEQ